MNHTLAQGQPAATVAAPAKKPFYRKLYVQVLFAIVLGILVGHFNSSLAVGMKPLGDGFIKLIKMLIAPIVFCTVVSGIAGMQDIKKVGRVGGKALLYFEIVSTLALLIGLVVGNGVKPGAGFNINPATLDAKTVMDYAGKAKQLSTTDFVMNIIPLGIDRFMSEARALVNMIGNGVATVVMSRWEKELDKEKLKVIA